MERQFRIVGDLAREVVTRAQCPVLVVRPRI
jgi:nucleotide-binding universal stress UspA family protein